MRFNRVPILIALALCSCLPGNAASAIVVGSDLYGARAHADDNNGSSTSDGGALSTAASATDGDVINAFAEGAQGAAALTLGDGTLMSANGLPTLQAFAQGASPPIVAIAEGVQAFRYDGAAPADIEVTAEFSATLTFSANVMASLTIFTADDFGGETAATLADIFDEGNLVSFLDETISTGDNTSGSASSNEALPLNLTVSLEGVNPGTDFWVLARFRASASEGIADGFATGVLNFTDPQGITTLGQTTIIPLPPAILLIAPALGLVGLRRRRG